MTRKLKIPVTPAVRALRAAGIAFEPFLYAYVERGGTAASAAALGVEEHRVIKTLILEDESGEPLVALMHGDQEVSTGRLAKWLGRKRVSPCEPKRAQRHSGYQVGGTSPFGLKRSLPIYAQETIRLLDRIWINGGKRGFLVSLSPSDLVQATRAQWVPMAADRASLPGETPCVRR